MSSLPNRKRIAKPSPSRIDQSKHSEILKSMLDIQEILDIDTDDDSDLDIVVTK